MISSNVSTQLIFEGLTYYKEKGYCFIDVPYCVPHEINDLTKPAHIPNTPHVLNYSYVGSAEQSFLRLASVRMLKEDVAYIALTPCVRNEQELDLTHFSVFLKAELFQLGHGHDISFLYDAKEFFEKYFNKIDIAITDVGLDLYDTSSELELGSYGSRSVVINDQKISYSYGTAFAEPRMSYAIKIGKSND